jgi:hypothetical protein
MSIIISQRFKDKEIIGNGLNSHLEGQKLRKETALDLKMNSQKGRQTTPLRLNPGTD